MTVRVLGPLEVVGPDGPVRLPGRREHVVLASLALRPNRVVTTDNLIDAVWENSPPATAVTQIHGCISALRKVLEAAGHPGLIGRVGDGYRLAVEPDDLDLLVFQEKLAQAASAAPHDARAVLGEALDLWRGPVLSGVRSEPVRRLADVFEEERLAAQERWLGLSIEAGDHPAAVALARRLAAEHPLREGLHALLATALYAAARQGDALAVLRELRQRLVEELGVDPSPAIRALEQRILSHADIGTSVPTSGPAHHDASSPASSSASGPHEGRRGPEVPRQLPRVLTDFVGRGRERAQIHGLFVRGDPEALRVVGIHGPGGIGKSTLAIRAGHELVTRFPDGQLYLDLDEVDAEDRAHILLGRAIRALGVDPNAVPGDIDERAELYRSLLADRRLLLVLDGVHTEEQVLPLLPGSSTCGVILTTRTRLGLLDGVDWIELTELDDADSMSLLGAILGEQRVRGELDSSRELARYAGGLPLALRIAGTRLASRPRWKVAELTRRMENESRRLDEFSHRGRELRAGLASSYRSVPAAAKKLFRLASMIEGPSVPAWLAAVLLDSSQEDAESALEALYDAHLLQLRDPTLDGGGFRFGFHPLVRSYASELLDGDPGRVAALERVLGAWLTLLDTAHRAEYGGGYHTVRGTTPRYSLPAELLDTVRRDAQGWSDSERETIIRAVLGASAADMAEACWEIADAMTLVFERRGYRDDWADTAAAALDVCLRTGNRLGEAVTLMSLSRWAVRFGLDTDHGVRALKIFADLGHAHGMGLQLIEQTYAAPRDNVGARYELARQAADALRVVDDPVAEAAVASVFAWAHFQRGELDDALSLLERTRDLCHRVGYARGTAQMELRLAQVELSRARPEAALSLLRRVRDYAVATRDPSGEAYALRWMGEALEDLGDLAAAADAFAQAANLADEFGLARLTRQLAMLRS